MIDFPYKDVYDWDDFLEIVRLLRSENGCPWDRVQTHDSIRRNFLEETYEALDALDRDNADDMREELGDVILQCAFHAQIERERGRFAMPDVIDAVTRKLLYRHPHVFGDMSAVAGAFENNRVNDINNGGEMPNNNIDIDIDFNRGRTEIDGVTARNSVQALETWEARKRQEKGYRSVSDAIEAVPHTLPALWRAEKIQKKVSKAGFDWDDIGGALDKLEEEVGELREAVEKLQAARLSSRGGADDGNGGRNITGGENGKRDITGGADIENIADILNAPHGVREEAGDVLFMAAKIAQAYYVDPEDALHRSCDKFERRFRLVENAADKPLSDYTSTELVDLWKNAKKHEK